MTTLRASLALITLSALSAAAQFQPPGTTTTTTTTVTTTTGEPLPTSNEGGVKAAIDAVPMRLRNNIVKISADNGTPNPPAWYIVAKTDNGEVYSVTVKAGQVIEEKPSLNLRALFTAPAAIDLTQLAVGSDGAWAAAQNYCQSKGRKLGSVSYALEQKGRNAAPLWSIWCYGGDGGYIGYLEILASNGTVISSE